MYAGAKDVVATLWNVDDVGTAKLMVGFYRGMLSEGMRPSEALRAAQNAIRKQAQWAAPYYWALLGGICLRRRLDVRCRQEIERGGQTFIEVAYGWQSLGALHSLLWPRRIPGRLLPRALHLPVVFCLVATCATSLMNFNLFSYVVVATCSQATKDHGPAAGHLPGV